MSYCGASRSPSLSPPATWGLKQPASYAGGDYWGPPGSGMGSVFDQLATSAPLAGGMATAGRPVPVYGGSHEASDYAQWAAGAGTAAAAAAPGGVASNLPGLVPADVMSKQQEAYRKAAHLKGDGPAYGPEGVRKHCGFPWWVLIVLVILIIALLVWFWMSRSSNSRNVFVALGGNDGGQNRGGNAATTAGGAGGTAAAAAALAQQQQQQQQQILAQQRQLAQQQAQMARQQQQQQQQIPTGLLGNLAGLAQQQGTPAGTAAGLGATAALGGLTALAQGALQQKTGANGMPASGANGGNGAGSAAQGTNGAAAGAGGAGTAAGGQGANAPVSVSGSQVQEMEGKGMAALVMYSMNGCGACRIAGPMLQQAAACLNIPVVVAESVTIPPNDMPHGFPTFFLIHNGNRAVYTGPSDARSLVQFVYDTLGPSAVSQQCQ